jgi:hypothetical protein
MSTDLRDPREDQELVSRTEAEVAPLARRGEIMTPQDLETQRNQLVHAMNNASATRTSPETDEIYGAIARIQGKLVSPRRNKKVTVPAKDGRAGYSYRYATLDVVNDMMRPHLAAEGVAYTQPIVARNGGTVQVTHIHHTLSGQWIEFDLPLVKSFDPKVIASNSTYIRRYSTCSFWNIAADEDDDGNHQQVAVRDANAPDEAPRQQAGGVPAVGYSLQPILRTIARSCAPQPEESASDIDYTLDYVHRLLPELERLRGDETAWKWLEGQIRGAIKRVIASDVAAIYWSAFVAVNPVQWSVFEDKLAGSWAPAMAGMAARFPETHKRLVRHIDAQKARIEKLAPKPPTPAVETETGRRPRSDELADDVAAIESKLAAPPAADPAPSFAHHLLDEHGEIASDLYTDPAAFTRDYLDMLAHAPEEARRNITHHNADAVADAWHDPRCEKMLEQRQAPDDPPSPETPEPKAAVLQAEPEPATDAVLYVQPMRNEGGHVQIAPWLANASASLARHVSGNRALDAWIEANRATFSTFPPSSQVRVLDRINARCRELAIAQRATL